jgi:REP element-mobilizing transposase RayT
MWNDTDTPLAVFFTFRCYGTWLHGDERGSVDRTHNIYGSPKIKPSGNWRKHNQKLLLHPPFKLDADGRGSVARSIEATCFKRGWGLHAVNIRTNHVHVVASIGTTRASQGLIALKANATRQLREDGLWRSEHTPWADKGSKRRLWNEKSVWEACDYVLNGQGDDLPDDDQA